MRSVRQASWCGLGVSTVLVALLGAQQAAAQATALIPSGVNEVGYSMVRSLLHDPAIIWSTTPDCAGGPIGAGLPGVVVAAGAPGDELSPALLTRGTTGGAPPRKLYEANALRPVATCNPYKLVSNLAVDDTHIYFVDNALPFGNYGLWRRSRNANPGDQSQLLRDLAVSGAQLTNAEVIVFGPYLFVILRGGFQVMAEYFKETGQLIDPAIRIALSLRNMQFDGRFLYWIQDGNLIVNDTTNGFNRVFAFGVSTYLTLGYDDGCTPVECDPTAFVTYAESNNAAGNRILTQDYFTGFTYTDYTAPPNFSIGSLTRATQHHAFFLRGPAASGGFNVTESLIRSVAPGPSAGVPIYGPFINHAGFDSMANDAEFLYFRDRAAETLLKLRLDSPSVVRQLRATGLEVVQAIQNPANAVRLIAGKATFVRFYVRSDGPTDVPGVAASLDVFRDGIFQGRLQPSRSKLLTVRRNPSRASLADSFFFEVPLAWVKQGTVSFTATMNGNQAVTEDTYANNTAGATVGFSQSPIVQLEIVSWRYNRNGALVTGNLSENAASTRYLKNVYPLAPGGSIATSGPGLRLATRTIVDDALTPQVDQTNTGCIAARQTATTDDRNLCACDYAMMRVRAMNVSGDLPADRRYYSSIAGDATTPFTRGYALLEQDISCGPMRDNSAQQNYMAHEVGHLLNQSHPSSGAAPTCPGQDAADQFYPYPQARIGNSTTAAGDETAHMGLDTSGASGAVAFLRPEIARPASTHGDIMSYCAPYWISDYIFEGIYNDTIIAAAALPRAAGPPQAAAIPGDWLLAFGSFSTTGGAGTFNSVRRLGSVAEVPVLTPGGYALELRNGAGALLASHPFTPESIEDGPPSLRTFGLVVPFVPGTRSLRLVEVSTSDVLATHPVSASPPSIGDVELVGAVEPVSGVVTVAWNANDPDGDPLTFDLFYSNDAGNTWQPIGLSVTGSDVEVETEALGGGTGRIRVEANDGAQSARAESAPFEVANKPPRLLIESPTDGLQIQWGQVVNLIAFAEDPDGGPIDPQKIVWSNAYRDLGTGPEVSVMDLEVGANVISLAVTDEQGQLSMATVNVQVGDVLTAPATQLSASPSPLAWQVPGNSSAVVSSDLLVQNSGTGGVLFTATSNQPWLRINGSASVTAGTGTTLAITADASGLPDNGVSAAEILLANRVDPSDTLVVPASVYKGDLVGGNPFSDQDADGMEDRTDNCIAVANGPVLPGPHTLDQRDTNGDGYGNACDPDLNDDGVVNVVDLARLKQVFFKTDPDADLNGDGVVNAVDLALLKAAFFSGPGPSGNAP